MHTLQEFMIYAKIADYVIAVAFFLTFIGFWRVLDRKLAAREDSRREDSRMEAEMWEPEEDQEVDKAA